MSIQLNDYQEVAGPGVVDELRALAARVSGRHINSTPVGEFSHALAPLLRELGIESSGV